MARNARLASNQDNLQIICGKSWIKRHGFTTFSKLINSFVCLSPRHNGWLKAGLLLRTVGVSGLSRKSDIRWPHCGNCINPRHFPKRWEKVALEFKRRVPLRDLPQLPSGNQISVFTDHQRWPLQTSAPSGVECGEKQKQEYNSIHGLYLRAYLVNRTHSRWWIPSSSACCVDCTVLLQKVSSR